MIGTCLGGLKNFIEQYIRLCHVIWLRVLVIKKLHQTKLSVGEMRILKWIVVKLERIKQEMNILEL